MEAAFSELPLALFTTLAPAGAGAFIALAVAVMTAKIEDDALRKLDRMSAIPLGVVLVSFICAFFHLASPFAALGVFANAGSSPLSNELIAGCVFFVVALAYWILGMAGKLTTPVRKGMLVACAVLALVFAVFMGMAYLMPTIIGWDTPATVVQMVGYALCGGTALGLLTLRLSGCLDAAIASPCKTICLVLVCVGALAAIIALAAQVAMVSGMGNALVSGSELAASVTGCVVFACICLVVGAACAVLCLMGKGPKAMAACAAVLAVAGVFLGRLAFYALELSLGPIM